MTLSFSPLYPCNLIKGVFLQRYGGILNIFYIFVLNSLNAHQEIIILIYMETILNVLSVLGGLAMFLYGMALMSEGLQKSAGDRLRAFMAKMTSNAFKRVLTGTVVTCLIQSSSATTIMVVSFVNAGLLTLL